MSEERHPRTRRGGGLDMLAAADLEPMGRRGMATARASATRVGAEIDSDLEGRFNELVEQWVRERGGASIRVHDHPAYAEILAMGEAAIPLILRHLRDQGWHWYRHLRELSGEDPVPAEEFDRGRIRDLWLEWGEDNGWL